MNKAFWGNFKNFGRLLGKNNLFLTPSRTDRSQSDVCPKITGQFSRYSRQQIPSDTLHCLFPSNTFLPRTYHFSQMSQPAKLCMQNRYYEEQIHRVPLNLLKCAMKGNYGKFRASPITQFEPEFDPAEVNRGKPAKKKQQQQQQQTGLTSLDNMQPARIFLIPVINYAVISNNCI